MISKEDTSLIVKSPNSFGFSFAYLYLCAAIVAMRTMTYIKEAFFDSNVRNRNLENFTAGRWRKPSALIVLYTHALCGMFATAVYDTWGYVGFTARSARLFQMPGFDEW